MATWTKFVSSLSLSLSEPLVRRAIRGTVNLKLYPINNENVPSLWGFEFRAPTPPPIMGKW